MLLTLIVLCAVVAVVGLLFVLLVVVPFVLTVDLAERGGFSTARWGSACVAAVLVTAALALRIELGGHTRVLHLVPLALVLLPPLVVSLLDHNQTRVGGSQGAHER